MGVRPCSPEQQRRLRAPQSSTGDQLTRPHRCSHVLAYESESNVFVIFSFSFSTYWVECSTPNYLTVLLNQYGLINTTDYLTVLLVKPYCFLNPETLGKQFLSTCFWANRKIWRVWLSTNNKIDYPRIKSQENSCPKHYQFCFLISTV